MPPNAPPASCPMWRRGRWTASFRNPEGTGMKRIIFRSLFVLACLLVLPAGQAVAAPVPRTILALYDGKTEPQLRFSNVHQLAAMPLNYLGLTVEFHDIRKGLPEIAGRDDLRGILMWLTSQQVDEPRSEEHTSELQSLMRISSAVF